MSIYIYIYIHTYSHMGLPAGAHAGSRQRHGEGQVRTQVHTHVCVCTHSHVTLPTFGVQPQGPCEANKSTMPLYVRYMVVRKSFDCVYSQEHKSPSLSMGCFL